MEHPISLKEMHSKYKIYSESMLRTLFRNWKLITWEKIGNTIVVDELIEIDNLKRLKEAGKKKWRKPKKHNLNS